MGGVIHSEDTQGFLEAWATVMKEDVDQWTYEARYRMKDGKYRYFLVRAQAMRDDEGKTVRWAATMLDTHESVLARMRVESLRQAILRLLSRADVSLWGVDQNHETFIREGVLTGNRRVVSLVSRYRCPRELQREPRALSMTLS